jgi:hypothetical protein
MLTTAVAALVLLAGALEDHPAFVEGQNLYRDLEFEVAAEKFRAASEDGELEAADRATALVWEGMCWAGIGDEGKARGVLKSALEIDPEVALPEIAPPKVRQLVDELIDEVAGVGAVEEVAPQPEPQPESQPEPEAEAGGELPMMMIAGGSVAGLGALAVVAGGGLAGLSVVQFGDAESKVAAGAFQDEVVASLDLANLELGAGVATGLVGLALVGVGGTLIALDLTGE